MTRIYLLGIRSGPLVDAVDGFVITAEDDSQAALDTEEARLRSHAMALQRAWFEAQREGCDQEVVLAAKAAYGRALRAWARFTANREAADYAYKLLNGFV